MAGATPHLVSRLLEVWCTDDEDEDEGDDDDDDEEVGDDEEDEYDPDKGDEEGTLPHNHPHQRQASTSLRLRACVLVTDSARASQTPTLMSVGLRMRRTFRPFRKLYGLCRVPHSAPCVPRCCHSVLTMLVHAMLLCFGSYSG